MKKISIFVLLIVTTFTLFAQQDPSKASRDALAILKGNLGQWQQTAFYFDNQTKQYVKQAQSVVSIETILKGLGIREKHKKFIQGKTIGLDISYGFDQYRDVYRLFVLDDSYGVPDVYEGKIIDNKLIATNIGKGTSYPLQNGGKLEFRFSMELTQGDNFIVLIDMTADEGNNWSPMYRYEYERIN